MGRRPSPNKPCGTVERYRQHMNRGEQPCQPCKDAHAAYKRETYIRKPPRPKAPNLSDVHRQMVRAYKFAAGACMDCGLVVDDRTIVCFDLDHRDPQQKSFTISYKIGSVSINALRDEMSKCDVVCRNCHAIRTHKERHWAVRRNGTSCEPSLFDVS
jgi:hypothetical protein